MDKDRWQRLQSLFHDSLELASNERHAFLVRACGDDQELLRQLESMLAAEEDAAQEVIADALSQVGSDAVDDPQTIGPYRVLKRIGVGGMGVVYLGEKSDGSLDRQVALKVVKKGMDTEEVLARFDAERHILARLDHPNIARLLDGGATQDGRPYFVMEHVDGVPIDRYCDEKRLAVKDRLKLFGTVCDAVHHAHQSLVIHRDLKPSNILVTEDGTTKLVDFGIAKVLDDSIAQHETRTGGALLTPAYAAPEQLAGDDVTTAVDVYAIGVLLYELLTSRRPFEATRTDAELRELVLRGDPAPPSSVVTQLTNSRAEPTAESVSTARNTGPDRLRKDLRGDLDNICLKALSRVPRERYRSADQVAGDIVRHLQGLPITARQASLRYRIAKFMRRHRAPVTALALAVLTLAAVVVFYTEQLARERDAAIQEQQKTAEVVDFVTGLFLVSDPSESRGEEISARSLVDDGVERLRSDLSGRPTVRAKMLSVLGEVNYSLGDSETAEQLLEEALALQIGLYGKRHLDVATTQLVLGLIRQDRGDLDGADSLYRESLATRESLVEPTHIDVIEAVNVRAFLEESKANYQAAEALYRQGLELSRQRSPAQEDELVAQSMTKLAGLYRVLDRNDEAEELLRKSIVLQADLYGGDHPELASTQRQLAGLLRETGRYAESKSLYEALIASRIKMLGADHMEVAHTYNSYSQLLSKMDDTPGAIEAQLKMVDIIIRKFGDVHPSLGAAYNNLALYKRDLGNLDEALEYYDKAFVTLDKLELPPDHMNRSFLFGGKASIVLRQERWDEAEALYLKSLEIRRARVPEEHRLISELKSSLGAVYIGQQRYSEAIEILEDAYQRFLDSRGEDNGDTKAAARRLAEARRLNDDGG